MNRGRRNPRELVQSRIKQPRLDEDNGDSLVLEELSTNAHAATELCHGSILRIRLINFLYVICNSNCLNFHSERVFLIVF